MNQPYDPNAPTRAAVDAFAGPAVLEFGTDWCGFCRVAQPLITAAFASRAHIQHLKIEDGKGRPLGRSFQVKLWPTLIFLDNGREVARVVRPQGAPDLEAALDQIDPVRATHSGK